MCLLLSWGLCAYQYCMYTYGFVWCPNLNVNPFNKRRDLYAFTDQVYMLQAPVFQKLQGSHVAVLYQTRLTQPVMTRCKGWRRWTFDAWDIIHRSFEYTCTNTQLLYTAHIEAISSSLRFLKLPCPSILVLAPGTISVSNFWPWETPKAPTWITSSCVQSSASLYWLWCYDVFLVLRVWEC